MKHVALKVSGWMAVAGLVGICLLTVPAAAQQAGAPAARGDAATAQEVQRLFDAYVVIRAQEFLKLDDEKFTAFLPKLKALGDARRRGEQAHNQFVAELAKLTAANAQADEAKIREVLKSLQDADARTAADLKKAYDAVDQMLDVHQQARFRVFEVQMERRKIDLLLQARRADAAKPKDEPAPVKKAPVK